MLVSDGEDLRKLPLSMRKNYLSRLLARRVDGSIWRHSSRARSGRICSATLLMGLEVASAHERRNSVSAAMFTPGTSGKFL
jgi:ATP-dependent DNA ligase